MTDDFGGQTAVDWANGVMPPAQRADALRTHLGRALYALGTVCILADGTTIQKDSDVRQAREAVTAALSLV